MSNIKIKLVRSTIKTTKNQKLVVKALGLNKRNSFVVKEDNQCIKGAIKKINHLVEVSEVK